MKLQFLNSIPLEIISGGNLYNQMIIANLKKEGISVDYHLKPANNHYDCTIVDSLYMNENSLYNLFEYNNLIALIHQIPELEESALHFYKNKVRFVVTSQSAKKSIVKNWQLNTDKVTVIRPGVSSDWKPKSEFNFPPKRILVVANFVKGKGYEMLIPILNHKAFHNLEFYVVGNNLLDISYAEGIVSEIKKTKADVKFHLNSSREEVYQLLLASDIFLSLSQSETFGMAIFEALNMGLPTISFKTGDYLYFKQYNNYLMLDTYDESSFIQSIESLINTQEESKMPLITTFENRREWPQVCAEFSQFLKTIR